MAPGLEGLVSLHDEFFTYADHTEESGAKTLRDLERLVEEDGPFDGIMGFSLGARCAATLLIHQIRCSQALKASQPVFRCAVFFCGGAPEDPTALLSSGDRRVMCFETDGEVIDIPTAHIWGRNDHRYHYGPQLSKLCNISNREVYVHDGGHEIPGSRDPVATAKAARSIKRTIARASMTRF
ncbi:hypothetical protein G4B11_010698 [Aspergillus flavus]|nr:hypothetical protein G4B11_010698 [Aspergillus flavus]